MISHDQFQPAGAPTGGPPPQLQMGQHQGMNTTFEMREAAVDRTKKRLEKYRRTAEKKEIDYDAFLDEKLRNDMRETSKYLAKVNESKMRKNKGKESNKKDLPTGVGGLSQNQADSVQSKIREHIQAEIKKTPAAAVGGDGKKRKKNAQTFDPLAQLQPLPSDSSFALLPGGDINPFPDVPGFGALSDTDIRNVLNDVKTENPNRGYDSASQTAAVSSPPVVQPPTSSEFNYAPGYQANFPGYLPQQYNATQQQQQQYNSQMWNQPFQQATTQLSYSTDSSQAYLHDFLSNQHS